MFEASTPPKEIQAHVACPLSINAQNAQESKPQELITHACKALRAIYAGWWLHKKWGQGYFVELVQIRYHFWGVKHGMGLQFALESNLYQTVKTIRPAVEQLHCCITKAGSIQCFTNSLLTELNRFLHISSKIVFEDEHLFRGCDRHRWLLPNHGAYQFGNIKTDYRHFEMNYTNFRVYILSR